MSIPSINEKLALIEEKGKRNQTHQLPLPSSMKVTSHGFCLENHGLFVIVEKTMGTLYLKEFFCKRDGYTVRIKNPLAFEVMNGADVTLLAFLTHIENQLDVAYQTEVKTASFRYNRLQKIYTRLRLPRKKVKNTEPEIVEQLCEDMHDFVMFAKRQSIPLPPSIVSLTHGHWAMQVKHLTITHPRSRVLFVGEMVYDNNQWLPGVPIDVRNFIVHELQQERNKTKKHVVNGVMNPNIHDTHRFKEKIAYIKEHYVSSSSP